MACQTRGVEQKSDSAGPWLGGEQEDKHTSVRSERPGSIPEESRAFWTEAGRQPMAGCCSPSVSCTPRTAELSHPRSRGICQSPCKQEQSGPGMAGAFIWCRPQAWSSSGPRPLNHSHSTPVVFLFWNTPGCYPQNLCNPIRSAYFLSLGWVGEAGPFSLRTCNLCAIFAKVPFCLWPVCFGHGIHPAPQRYRFLACFPDRDIYAVGPWTDLPTIPGPSSASGCSINVYCRNIQFYG